MECKLRIPPIPMIGSLELIDTLWNVNFSKDWFIMLLNLELIDTLWNVNSL